MPEIEMEREDHPYDRGYSLRYDGKPRDTCASDDERRGWDQCDVELKFEWSSER